MVDAALDLAPTEAHLDKAAEEAGELVAASHQFKAGRIPPSALADEVADNILMAMFLERVLERDHPGVFEVAMQKKLARLEQRVQAGDLKAPCTITG